MTAANAPAAAALAALVVNNPVPAGEPSITTAVIPMRLPSATSRVLSPVAGSFEAPAAITWRPAAGEPTVASPGPEFPAAATTTVPVKAALSAAVEVASSGPPAPPRLMLITLAIGFGCIVSVTGDTASSKASVIASPKQLPVPVQTL